MEICDAIIINDKFYSVAENLDSLKELETNKCYADNLRAENTNLVLSNTELTIKVQELEERIQRLEEQVSK